MEKIEVNKMSLEHISDSLDKASSLIDLVRQQLEAKHESAGGMVHLDCNVTTPFQLAALLELVDGLLLGQYQRVNEMLGVTAE